MRSSFLIWFEKNYPGMDPEGPTGGDSFEVYSEGFNAGVLWLALAMREDSQEAKA